MNLLKRYNNQITGYIFISPAVILIIKIAKIDIKIRKTANRNLFLYLSLNSDHNQYEKINNNKPKTKIQKELISPNIRL